MNHIKSIDSRVESTVAMALTAYQAWTVLGFHKRIELLQRWSALLDPKSKEMLEFQCRNALEYVADRESLIGPTGETNELYCSGRGVLVVAAQKGTDFKLIVAQITMALVTGNCILLCLPELEIVNKISEQLQKVGFPEAVIQTFFCQKLDKTLKDHKVSGLIYIGSLEKTQKFASILANRNGLLAQLIAETDAVNLPVIGSPTYALHFITEKTCTTNITAVGGNATLLELGSGESHNIIDITV